MKSINFLSYIFAQSIELQANHFGRDQFVLKPGIEHMLVILNLSKNHMMKQIHRNEIMIEYVEKNLSLLNNYQNLAFDTYIKFDVYINFF